MSKNFKAELVGAFGDPIAENPTGVMQEAGFRAAGLDWRYLTLQVKAGRPTGRRRRGARFWDAWL